MNKEHMGRLRRLEVQFAPPQETEFDRHLRERLEAGRRRVAESRMKLGLPPLPEYTDNAPNRHRTIVEILNSGRQRNALAHRALTEARIAPSEPIAGEAGPDET